MRIGFTRRAMSVVAVPLLICSLVVTMRVSNAAPAQHHQNVWKNYSGPAVTLQVWTYPQDDPTLFASEKALFEKLNPKISLRYVVLPESNYGTKISTTLQARKPPDVAIIEDQAWMKAGKVVRLNSYLPQWGVKISDFNPGGLGRLALQGNPQLGMYAVGDWMDGNVLVYNKKLFRQAHVPFPSSDRSMTWQQYASVCRKVARLDSNPTKTVFGCSVPDWSFGIWSKWLYGSDGHHALGHINSPAMIQAWNLGTALARDKMAPSSSMVQSLPNGEPDLFTQGRLAMTWSDFTFAKKYKANHIDFGVAPFQVIKGSPSFVDTWTAAWGTFKDSPHKAAALQFLKFISTDAQRVTATHSFIPPEIEKYGRIYHYGRGNPAEQQFVRVLRHAQRQVFIPPLGPGAYDSPSIYNKLTIQRQTDAKKLLDEAARKTQPILNKAWQQWKSL